MVWRRALGCNVVHEGAVGYVVIVGVSIIWVGTRLSPGTRI